MRVILAGIIGRYPWGGVTWCSLMYLLGFRRLGHDVYYLEDTLEANYDPEIDALATDPRYALDYIDRSLRPFGFGDRWCYVDYQGGHHGIEAERWRRICRDADLFVVLSGGCWVWRDHYRAIAVKAFIDSDPGFTQLALDNARRAAPHNARARWYVDFFRGFDRLFTFGGHVGSPRCDVPTGDFVWRPTCQPICVDLWTPPSGALPPRNVWTTVMTWKIESFTDVGGNKDEEFLAVVDLANRCRSAGGPEVELALNGPREFLAARGWRCVDAFAVSRDLWRYHSYLSTSRGEFSVAKRTYVRHRTGWFSDRTACYLALGRPAVVQDTGWSELIPAGRGLLAWGNAEEAREALERVERDYAAHARAAREVACERFDDRVVLQKLLTA